LNALQKQYETLQTEANALSNTLMTRRAALNERHALGEEQATHCSVCESPLNDAFHQKYHNEKDLVNTWKSLQTQQGNLKEDMSVVQNTIQNLTATLKEMTLVSDNLSQLKQRVFTLANAVATQTRTVDMLTHFKRVFHEGGPCIQKYLSDQLLKSLCQKSEQFISTTFGKKVVTSYSPNEGFSFNVDNTGARNHQSFSGGERTIFALGIALAMHAFLQEQANITLNLLFIDEGFHTFMSEASIERLMSTLEKQINSSIGIITHNEKLIPHFQQVITVNNGSISLK
jgi:DNA repair exonuclease SbcCD ATPase subunit